MNKAARRPRTRPRHGVKSRPVSAKQRDTEHGEGNYKAARQYDERVSRFVKSGKVEEAARASRPRSHREAREMEEAEARGKRRSKGEDAAPGMGRR